MSVALLLRLTVVAVFGGGWLVGLHTPATAEESFPWCVQGETLQCYYATREQCELTVDYHGFCVRNPYPLPQTHPQPRQRGQVR